MNDAVERAMELQIENEKLKQAINKATKYIKENSDYEEVGDDYTSICEKIFEGDVDELLQILNEGGKE